MTRVIWMNLNPQADARGSWDQGIVEELTAGYDHQVWGADSGAHTQPLGSDGAVVVIPGQHNLGNYAKTLGMAIARLPWALTIVTSDEEALFPLDAIPRDDSHLVYTQYHYRGMDRVIPIGTPPGTAESLAEIGDVARMGDVFFAGQDTHVRRHELIETMKEMAADPNRYGNLTWAATTGFRAGLSQDRYLEGLRDARVAPCPSGPHSLDSFRLYEAIAAGCLPVIEMNTPHGPEPHFWVAMFGEGCPIPWVSHWEQLAPIVESQFARRESIEPPWPRARDRVQEWWNRWRAQLDVDFADTITRLRSS